MKKIFLMLVLTCSFAQAKEVGTQFVMGVHMAKMKTAIRDSYQKEGVSENVIKKIELELYSLESIDSQSVLQNLDQLELAFTFSSSYVRDEDDGVSDLCTVKMQSTVSFGSAGTWTVKSASCESYD
jgi:hypothetical protein